MMMTNHHQQGMVMEEEGMEHEVMEEEVMVGHQCLIYLEMMEEVMEEVDMDNLQLNEFLPLHNPD